MLQSGSLIQQLGDLDVTIQGKVATLITSWIMELISTSPEN